MKTSSELKTTDQEIINLIEKALAAREFSYSPYSNFQVGAAILTEAGKIYTGCNIENAGYTSAVCAERTAIFKAVSEGQKRFKRIAIVGSPKGTPTQYAAPCGVCRQVMMEFCKPKSFEIIIAKSTDDYMIYTLEELLPMGFGPEDLL